MVFFPFSGRLRSKFGDIRRGSSRSSIVVELVGKPGAGKSTIARHLATRLTEQGRIAMPVNLTGYHSDSGSRLSRRQIRLARVLALTQGPMITFRVLKCLWREGTGDATSWMVNLCRRDHAARRLRRRPGITVLEEGPLMALCFAFAALRRTMPDYGLLRAISVPNAVVVLHVSDCVAHERVVRRGGVWSDVEFARMAATNSRILDAWHQIEPRLEVPIHHFDTDHTAPELLARQISADLGGGSHSNGGQSRDDW